MELATVSQTGLGPWPLPQEDDAQPTMGATGDILLFSGDTWAARTVKWTTCSIWSHVALLIHEPELASEPLVWEATRCSPLQDIRHGVCIGDGVQLVRLRDKLAHYPGRIMLRRWRGAPRPSWAEVLAAMHEHQTRPYLDYVRSNLRAWWGGEARMGTFCSEFVVDVLRAWKFLAPGRPSRLYVPRHLASSLAAESHYGDPSQPQALLARKPWRTLQQACEDDLCLRA